MRRFGTCKGLLMLLGLLLLNAMLLKLNWFDSKHGCDNNENNNTYSELNAYYAVYVHCHLS